MKKILLVFVCSLFAFETVWLKRKTPWDYGWEMAWNFFINAIFRLGIFCNSRWRLLILKGCPLRESIIGAAAGGIGHPGLAIGI